MTAPASSPEDFVARANALVSLLGIPSPRAVDLAIRAGNGTLTYIESLAVAILSGGASADQATQFIIEKAIEEYGYGSYRVPVRVIGDMDKCFAVISTHHTMSQRSKDVIRSEMQAFMARSRHDGNVLMVDSGLKVEFYEVEKTPEEKVEIVQPEHSDENGVQ